MPMRSRTATVCAALVSLAACSNGAETSHAVQVTESDSAGVTIVTIWGEVSDLPLWRLADLPDLEISGAAAPYLSSIGQVAFRSDGTVLVEDDQSDELRLFDAAGGVKRLIGGAGQGPGEFQRLTTLTVTGGDTAYAYDRRLRRVSIFDPDGKLVRTFPVSYEDGGYNTIPFDVWAVDSEHLVLHRLSPYDSASTAPRPRRDQRDVVLFALDGAGRVRESSIRFTGGYSIDVDNGDLRAPFANRPFIAVSAGRIVHGSAVDYELTVSSPDLQPVRIVRWDGWGEPFTDEAIQEVRNLVEATWKDFPEAPPDLVRSIIEDTFSPNVLPQFLPALGNVVLDENGRFWVSAFRPPLDLWNEAGAWHILDPSGHPLARVRLPMNARIAAVRQNRVALIMRDSLDVEHLRVFRLLEAGPDGR